MKRNRFLAITVVMVLVLLIPYMSIAEATIPYFNGPYSVRSGIQFGMSIDEVSALEAKNQTGTPRMDEPGKYGELSNVTKMYYQVPSLAGIEVPLTVAGKVPESLGFIFDAEGHLFEIKYSFGLSDSSTARGIINKLDALLTQKYGKALHAADGNVFPLFSASLYDLLLFGYNITLNQWLVEYEDCYVVIDNYYYQNSKGKYGVYLAQRMLEKDGVEQKLKALKIQSDTYAQQEQNDI